MQVGNYVMRLKYDIDKMLMVEGLYNYEENWKKNEILEQITSIHYKRKDLHYCCQLEDSINGTHRMRCLFLSSNVETLSLMQTTCPFDQSTCTVGMWHITTMLGDHPLLRAAWCPNYKQRSKPALIFTSLEDDLEEFKRQFLLEAWYNLYKAQLPMESEVIVIEEEDDMEKAMKRQKEEEEEDDGTIFIDLISMMK